MKSVIASTLLALAAAQDEDPRKYNKIVKMSMTQITTSFDIRDIYHRLQNYGCYCFPEEGRAAGGAGTPVNAIDGLCKKLAGCHKCINMEHGADIDADKDKYKWDVTAEGDLDCSRNVDPAKRDLCLCDSEFAMEMRFVWSDSSYDEMYWLSPKQVANSPAGSKFDYSSTCQASGAGMVGVAVDACCGEAFPAMTPYHTANKDCCASAAKPYNVATDDCCGGHIAALGMC